MGNLFYKFIKLAISVFAIFLVSKVFLIKGVKADYMRPIEVCIRHVGYPNNNGVVELRDQKGARRFVRIGQGQYSTTPHVRDYYDCDGRRRKNCAFFQGWGLCMGVRECRDQRDGSSWLDYNGMDWLCSHGETFPAYLPPNWTKYKNYAYSCDLAHWGCGEDPLYIDVHIRDCECGSAVWGYGENHDNHGCNYPSRFTITCNCAPPLGQCGQSCAVTGICDVGYSCRNGVCCNRCSPTSYSCSGGCQCPCGTWCDYNSDCTTGLTCLEGRCCRYCSDTDDYQCSGGCQCLAPPTIESITPQAVCIDPTTGNPVDWSGRGMTVPFTVVYRSSSGAGGWGFDTIGFGVDLRYYHK
jgi:hypothetical protein